MNLTVIPSSILLAAETTAALTSRELDLPQSPFGWLLLLGGSVVVFAWVVWLYLRDTHELSPVWKAWLTILRLSVLGCLLVIALNPSDRTQKQAFRPSRVAIAIDTSLSMRHRAVSGRSDSAVVLEVAADRSTSEAARS
jgi:branched-subunit amino acid transport protein